MTLRLHQSGQWCVRGSAVVCESAWAPKNLRKGLRGPDVGAGFFLELFLWRVGRQGGAFAARAEARALRFAQ